MHRTAAPRRGCSARARQVPRAVLRRAPGRRDDALRGVRDARRAGADARRRSARGRRSIPRRRARLPLGDEARRIQSMADHLRARLAARPAAGQFHAARRRPSRNETALRGGLDFVEERRRAPHARHGAEGRRQRAVDLVGGARDGDSEGRVPAAAPKSDLGLRAAASAEIATSRGPATFITEDADDSSRRTALSASQVPLRVEPSRNAGSARELPPLHAVRRRRRLPAFYGGVGVEERGGRRGRGHDAALREARLLGIPTAALGPARGGGD